MMAVLPDSSTPSSDDNKSSSRGNVKQIQVLPYQEKSSRPSTVRNSRPTTNDSSSEDYTSSASPPKRDASPAILTNTIKTGSEFRQGPNHSFIPNSQLTIVSIHRIQQPRLHKKTSFTIINELVPNQSRPASPTGGRVSPFRGKGFRTDSSKRFSRPVSCPESPRNATDLDTISSHDDSQIHSRPSVHFNIIPPIPRKRTAIRVIESTIDDMDSRDSIDVSYHDRDMESFEMSSNGQIRSPQRRGSFRSVKPLPAPRQHIQRSAGSINRIGLEGDRFMRQPNVNPRSYQKGLLGVVNGAPHMMPSRIPRRKSSVSTPNISRNSSISSTRRDSRMSNSSDRLSMYRNRSISPRRKMSNDFGGSMIDLGMGPSSRLMPSRSINRISKPTTLSPIVGTPNKDCDQDSSQSGSDGMYKKYGGDSPTKIPIRRSSSVNINGIGRMGSRGNSRGNSREHSPMKSPMKSPTKIPQKVNQKGGSPVKGAKNAGESNGCTKPMPSSVNKESSSTKKEPAINREKSSVKKPPPATIKREPSTLKRQPSNLKRENSQQKLKRENSTIGIAAKPVKVTGPRDPTSTTLAKNQSDSSLVKRLEKKNSFKQKRRTSSESDGLNEIATANLSDKIIPLTKTNGLSMTTAAVTSQPIQITAAVTDHLSKKNSSGQIVNNDNSNLDSDNNNNNISSTNVSDPNANAKVDAADAATSDTATIASAAGKAADANGKADAASVANQEDTKSVSLAAGSDIAKASPTSVLEKKASSRTLGGKSDAGSVLGTPVVPEANLQSIERELIGTPIETKVNVIDNSLINSVDSETFQTKPREQPEPGTSSPGGAQTTENGLGDSNDKDNGMTSHMDSSPGAKNDTWVFSSFTNAWWCKRCKMKMFKRLLYWHCSQHVARYDQAQIYRCVCTHSFRISRMSLKKAHEFRANSLSKVLIRALFTCE